MPGRKRDADVETSGHRVAKERRDAWGDGNAVYTPARAKHRAVGGLLQSAHISAQRSVVAQRGGTRGWEGNPGGRAYMCTYSGFMSLYRRS